MAFIDDLADLMTDTLIAHPGVLDGYGGWLASGAALVIPCRIEASTRLVTDQSTGREVATRFQVFTNDYYNLNPQSYRYTLPSRYIPSSQLTAYDVIHELDEEGEQYEVVIL